MRDVINTQARVASRNRAANISTARSMPIRETRRFQPVAHHATFAAIALLIWCTISIAADDVTEARRLRDAGVILPLATIIERATKEHNGRVIGTEFEPRDGLYLYEIEILDGNGAVWELEYDAANGVLLAHKIENK